MENGINNNLFDYSVYNAVIEVAENENDIEAVDMIRDSLKSAVEYIHIVDDIEISLISWKLGLDAADYRFKVQEADRCRRVAHDAAIAQCRIANRISNTLVGRKICTANLDDRLEVAEYCMEVAKIIFHYRKR